jgi:hypothetical protein
VTVPEVAVDARTVDALGEAGVRTACAELWPVDCVSCGRPLGVKPPGLGVTGQPSEYQVRLHHVGCTPPFGEYPLVWAGVSWRMFAFSFSGTPTVVLNPAAEQIHLRRMEDGWQVRPELDYPRSGLSASQLPLEIRMGEPLAMEPLRLTGERLELRLGGVNYSTDVGDEVADGLRRLDGCFLIVTHGIWPDAGVTYADLVRVLAGGQAGIGWAGMDSAAEGRLCAALHKVSAAVAENVPPPGRDEGPWLLRLTRAEQAVVQLLAVASVSDDVAALDWASSWLGGTVRPLPWREWGSDPVARRWSTSDPLTANGYDVIVHGEDARLYRQIAASDPPDGGGDEAAFDWAARVLGQHPEWIELAPTGRIRWFGA